MSQFKIEWIDRLREPQCSPDPNYPNGKDLDCRLDSVGPSCVTDLPYPAKRCGLYVVECTMCKMSVGCTTAGRPDDPRSVRMSCQLTTERQK